MATTKDFDEWLETIDVGTEQERDELIESVSNVSSAGDFTTTKNKGKYFVKGWAADTLLLASEKARSAFLVCVRGLDVPDENDEAFERAINNPKS